MPKAAFCGLPHSESEVYYVKSSAIAASAPPVQRHCGDHAAKVLLSWQFIKTHRKIHRRQLREKSLPGLSHNRDLS